MTILKSRKGMAMIESALLFAAVIASVAVMIPYVRRSFNAKLKRQSLGLDEIAAQVNLGGSAPAGSPANFPTNDERVVRVGPVVGGMPVDGPIDEDKIERGQVRVETGVNMFLRGQGMVWQGQGMQFWGRRRIMRGEELIQQGEDLLASGGDPAQAQALIDEGQALVAEGQAMVDEGQALIDAGNALILQSRVPAQQGKDLIIEGSGMQMP